MKVGSLFSGIGGLDLGLERAGMSVVWQCERDPYARGILAKHWPGVHCYEDVADIGADAVPVDLLCGGFPCQPISSAGQRKGIHDERWLWPHFARIAGLLRPRFVLLENVPGLLRPYEFPKDSGQWWPALIEAILTDLAALGYGAEWDCIPAAAVGAPHIRDRVFLLAYPDSERRVHGSPPGLTAEAGKPTQRVTGAGSGKRELRRTPRVFSGLADPSSFRLEGGSHSHGLHGSSSGERPGESARGSRRGATHVADPDDTGQQASRPGGGSRVSPAEPEKHGEPTQGGGDGTRGSRWSPEPDVGRVVDGVPDRVDRIKCLGNAVVPQVAEWIGRRIMTATTERTHAQEGGEG